MPPVVAPPPITANAAQSLERQFVTEAAKRGLQVGGSQVAGTIVAGTTASSALGAAAGAVSSLRAPYSAVMGPASYGWMAGGALGLVGGGINKVGGLIDRTASGIGNLTGFEPVSTVGHAIHSGTSGLQTGLEEVGSTLSAAYNFLRVTPTKEGHHVASKAVEHIAEKAGKFGKLGEGVSQTLSNTSSSLHDIEANLGGKIANVFSSTTATVGNFVSDKLHLQGVGEKIAHTPDALASATHNKSLMKTGIQISYYAGAAAQAIQTTATLTQRFEQLHKMYQDISGNEKASMFDALFAKDVPELFAHERGRIIASVGPAALVSAANAYVAHRMANMEMMEGMTGLAVALGAQPLIAHMMNKVMPSSPFMDVYTAMIDAEKQTGSAPPELYAALIVAASPTKGALSNMSLDTPFLQSLAMEYASKGAKPVEVLRDIESGALAAKEIGLEIDMIAAHQQRHAAQQAPSAVASPETPDIKGLTESLTQGRITDAPQLALSAR